MQLRHRILLIFVGLSLLVAGDLALDRYLVSERDALRKDVRERWQPARDATSDAIFALVDQQTAQRGYVITGDERALAPYVEGGERADRGVARVDQLVGDDRVIAPQVRRVVDRISAWRQLGAEFEIDAKRDGRDDAALVLVATGTSGRLFDEARVELSGLQVTIIDRLAEREDRLARVEQRSSVLRALFALVALALVVLGSRLMGRWLTRPLQRISGAVRRVASGELDHEIPAAGPPELATLGGDVEAMRQRIVSEVDEASRARSSLAQRGMIVLTLRDELAPAGIEPPPGLAIATRFRPAESIVAGDWYELHLTPGGDLVFVLADVSGHGPTAGIFALKTKQLVQIALQQDRGPADAWAWVSEHLGDTGDQFLTGVIGRIDTRRRSLTYASAGHAPLLLHDAGDTRALGPTGPIVGAFAGEWVEQTTRFGPGSVVVAYSDGLLEVQDRHGVWAELSSLQSSLPWGPNATADQLADMCLEFHDRHNGRKRLDDVTVVVITADPGG